MTHVSYVDMLHIFDFEKIKRRNFCEFFMNRLVKLPEILSHRFIAKQSLQVRLYGGHIHYFRAIVFLYRVYILRQSKVFLFQADLSVQNQRRLLAGFSFVYKLLGGVVSSKAWA